MSQSQTFPALCWLCPRSPGYCLSTKPYLSGTALYRIVGDGGGHDEIARMKLRGSQDGVHCRTCIHHWHHVAGVGMHQLCHLVTCSLRQHRPRSACMNQHLSGQHHRVKATGILASHKAWAAFNAVAVAESLVPRPTADCTHQQQGEYGGFVVLDQLALRLHLVELLRLQCYPVYRVSATDRTRYESQHGLSCTPGTTHKFVPPCILSVCYHP